MKLIVMRLVLICLVLLTSALFLLDLRVARATPQQRRSIAKSSGTQIGDLFKNSVDEVFPPMDAMRAQMNGAE